MSDVYVTMKHRAKQGRTVEAVPGVVMLDYGEDGELIGVEILGAAEFISNGNLLVLPLAAPPSDVSAEVLREIFETQSPDDQVNHVNRSGPPRSRKGERE